MKGIWSKAPLTAAVLLTGLFLLSVDLSPNQAEEVALPEPIALLGEYRVDAGAWLPLTEASSFDTERVHTTVFRGELSRDIPEDQSLLLYIRNLYVTLTIGGETVYRFGDPLERHFFDTPGIMLAEVPTGPVPRGTPVELTVTDAFQGVIPSIPDLLDSLSTGRRAQLYEKLVQVNGALIFACICSAILGCMSLLLALVSILLRIPYAAKAAALGFFALALGLWFLFSVDKSFLPLLIPRPRTAAAFDILSLYLMSLAGVALVHAYVGPAYRRWSGFFVALECAGQGALYLLQLLGLVQLYEAQALILPLMLVVAACFAVLAVDALRHKSSETRLAAACLIPAVLAGLMECIHFFVLHMSRSYLISTTGFVTTFLLLFLLLVYQMKQSNDALLRAHALEQDLMESRVAAMIGQIQPHFLYNALTAVEDLCETDPPKARKAVNDFAKYLRGNMSALTQRRPIPFPDELTHLRHYLDLERLRFGDRLRFHLEIGPTDFLVPALSIQPLVENAVKHGLTRRRSGGAVTLRTEESPSAWVVTVTDDGVGFDPSEPCRDGREHVGIANVRSRLSSMCGGTLEIDSAPGAGATATIRIPKAKPDPSGGKGRR